MPEKSKPELPASKLTYPAGFLDGTVSTRLDTGLRTAGKTIYWDSSIISLFPARSLDEWASLAASIKVEGIREKIRLAVLDHKSAIVADGNDRLWAYRRLQDSGFVWDFDWEPQYQPIPLTDASDRVKVLSDARAVAVAANLGERQNLDQEQRVEVVKRLDRADSAAGFLRAGSWIAELTGCSQGYVSQIRSRLIEAGELADFPKLLTRKGSLMKNIGYSKPAKVEPVVEPPKPDDDEGVDLGGTIDGTEPDDELDDEAVDGTEDKVEAVVETTPEPVKPLGPIDGFRYRDTKTIGAWRREKPVKDWFINLHDVPQTMGGTGTAAGPWPLYNGEPFYDVERNQWYRAIPGGREPIAGPYRGADGNWTLTRPKLDESARPYRDENNRWHHADGSFMKFQDGRKLDAKLAKELAIEATEVEPDSSPLSRWAERFAAAHGGVEALDAALDGLTDEEVNNEVARLAAALTIGKPVKVEPRRTRKQTAKV